MDLDDRVGSIGGGNLEALFFNGGVAYGLACISGNCEVPCRWPLLDGATDATPFLLLRAGLVSSANTAIGFFGCPIDQSRTTLAPQSLPIQAVAIDYGYVRLADGRLFASSVGGGVLNVPSDGSIVGSSDPPSQVANLPPASAFWPRHRSFHDRPEESCIADPGGAVWCWGRLASLPVEVTAPLQCGEAKTGVFPCIGPTRVPVLDGALDIAFLNDGKFTGGCVLQQDHTVKCWHRAVK